MIALSDVEEARRRHGIEVRSAVRGGQGAAGNYTGAPELVNPVDDLPFLFAAYRAEAPLRAWLESLYVTTFAHGHGLRVAMAEAFADSRREDAAIEACLLRGWVRPVRYAPREATTLNMGPWPGYWSCWTFEPAGELGAWLAGGPLPELGDPLRQAAYDGRLAAMLWLARERRFFEEDLEHALQAAYVAVQARVLTGEFVPGAIIDGAGDACVPWDAALSQLRASAREWADVDDEEALRAFERLERRGEMSDPAPVDRRQASLFEAAE